MSINWTKVEDALPKLGERVMTYAPFTPEGSCHRDQFEGLDIDWLESFPDDDGNARLVFAENKGKITHWAPVDELKLPQR